MQGTKRARVTVTQSSQDDGRTDGVRKYYGKSYIRRTVGVSSKSKSVQSIVARAINRATETKIARYNFTGDLTYYNSTIFGATSSSFPLSPYTGYLGIAQGTGQGDRIGNSIRPYKCTLRMTINPNLYNVTSNPSPCPHLVRMLILRRKDIGQSTLLTSFAGLFQTGNTAIAPQSNGSDIVNSINTDLYTVYHDEVLKIGYADMTGSGSSAAGQYFSNNDFKYNIVKTVDVTKFMGKKLTFNDATQTGLSGDTGLYCLFLICRADGTTPTAGNSIAPVGLYGNFEFKFKDA